MIERTGFPDEFEKTRASVKIPFRNRSCRGSSVFRFSFRFFPLIVTEKS